MYRFMAAACCIAALAGCSAPPLETTNVSFAQIEGAVEDMHTSVFGGHYSGSLGDDSLGPAVLAFQKSVKGTALEADAEKLAQKITEVTTLAAKKPPIAKLRTAVQELKDAVAEIKKKL